VKLAPSSHDEHRRAPAGDERRLGAAPAQQQYVTLRPALPAVLSGHGWTMPAFVHALSESRLRLKIGPAEGVGGTQPPALAPLPRLSGLSGEGTGVMITVSLDDGQQFRLPSVLLPGEGGEGGAAGTTEARVTSAEALTSLQDLATLVRKAQHLEICATDDVEAKDKDAGFGGLVLRPRALPELAWEDVDPTTELLGRAFPLPLLITGMTGGLARGAEINKRLARAAQRFGIPMGVGSQRVALDNPEHAKVFDVKTAAPDIFLIGNLGVAQLLSAKDPVAMCARAVAMIGADALALHVNVVQEAVQVEGDRDFRGALAKIAAVCAGLAVPVIVKEVGSGIDAATARALVRAGVAAIDCGGKGGTAWGWIEGKRAEAPAVLKVGGALRDWGVPTAVSVALLKRALPQLELVATGGIRDGVAVAKAVALGARACGIGLPLMRAALQSEDAVTMELDALAQGLKVAMLASGARTLADLPRRLGISREFEERVALWDESEV
jgi:isopentenyl-diphosphate delta-isomerase